MLEKDEIIQLLKRKVVEKIGQLREQEEKEFSERLNESNDEALEESFVSNLDKLTDKELTKKLNQYYGDSTGTKILFSKFISLKNGTTAKYAIVTFDDDEETYLVNFVELEHDLKNGIEVVDADAVPTETFDSESKAISYVKTIK
jgi:predicted ATP-binding protein involved in virulence